MRWFLPQPTRLAARGSRHRGLLLAALCLPLLAHGQGLEYRVKAAFLFNFAKFVEWPADSLPERVPLRVAILAPGGAFEVMADALAGKEVAGHTLAVLPFDPDAAPPHILFVHAEEEPLPAELPPALAAAHVLLVGESPGFAARYGIIGLVPRGDSLRFQINLAAARRAGLNLSGQLARLAEIVPDHP